MNLKILSPKKDAFDDIEDAFSEVELPPDEKVLNSPELKRLIAAEVAKAVAAIKIPAPREPLPQIVKETRVEVPAKDTRKLVEQSALDAALKKIEKLEKELEETDGRARNPIIIPSGLGGSGVIGIPPPEASTVGYVLTVDAEKKAKWKPGTGGGSGAGLSGYTVDSFTELKAFDPANTSLDEIARVLGSVIEDLQ